MTERYMGPGKLGDTGVVFKKKFRWTFNLIEGDKHHDPFFIKLNYRPFEDTEVNFLNQRPDINLQGYSDEEKKRLSTQVVNFIFIDAGDDNYDWKNPPPPKEPLATIYRWISEVYNWNDKPKENEPKKLWDHWGGTLTLYDGCGNALEKWTMPRIRPLAINFGDLDYSSSSELTVEVTLVYDTVDYTSLKMCDTRDHPKIIDAQLKDLINKASH